MARLKRLSALAGGLAAVLGVLVLIGWQLDIETLKRLSAGLVAMNPASAVCFILAGAALVLRQWPVARARPLGRGAILLCALAVLLIGALRLGSVLFGWPVPVDQLLFTAKLAAVGAQSANSMAPNSALNFVLAGGALLLLDGDSRRNQLTQLLALTAAFVALLALVGYTFGAQALYGVARYMPMAVHTAIGFLLLAAGILFARPDQGLMAAINGDSLGGQLARRLLPAAVLVPFVLGWLRLEGERRGLYSTAFGVAALTVASMVVLTLLIWWAAASLHQTDQARRQAEAALASHAELLASERDLLQTLLDNIPDTIYFKDTASRFTRINRAQARVLRVADPADAVGKTDADFQWPDLAKASFALEQEIISTGQPLIDWVEYNPTADGQPRWFSSTKVPLRDQAGRITGLAGISRDVSEHQQSQAALQAVRDSLEREVQARTRSLRMLSECNQALVRAPDEASLLGEVCRCIVEFGGYRLAWVGFAEDEAARRVRVAAQAGAGDDFLPGLDLGWGDDERGRGPTGQALRAGQPRVTRDLLREPAEAAWQERASALGYAASFAAPFMLDGGQRGVLTICSAEPRAFDDAESRLLEELARDVAYGLTTLRTRAALQRTDALLLETSRMARVGGWELDVLTQTPRWSEETYRIHEVNPSVQPDLAGAINFYAPEARPVIAAALQKAMADGTPFDLELASITATGKRLWVRSQAQAEFRDGRCVRLWGTFQDITGRKQAEEQIRQNTARVEALSQVSKALAAVGTSTVAVIEAAARLVAELIGDGCTVQLVSGSGPLFEPIAHYHRDPRAEIALRDMVAQFPPRVDEGMGGQVVKTGEAILIPLVTLEQLRATTKPEYWGFLDRYPLSSLLCVPLRSEGGVIGVIALTRITAALSYTLADQSFVQELADRVALVITNARLYEELERRVAERTQALQATNRELEAFSYSVSHDLRAPLRAMDGFSLVLLEDYADKIDAQGRDYLARVRGASQRMGQLIDGLLALARVTRADLRREPVDLSALAREELADLQAHDPDRAVEVVVASGLRTVGDPRLLHAVLDNLLGNAWKFTAKAPNARIELGRDSAAGDEPIFFVRDNGAGFDMAHSQKLFGAFQRLHARSEFDGLGIGLATVQRIVNRHGGRVWAEGQPGQGATFYFMLPE